jgi:murein L,D-transpeptidase YafK
MWRQKVNSHFFVASFLFWANASVALAVTEDLWLLVETQPRVLKVMAGDEAKEIFTRIAIGRKGAGFEKARNDDKTPLGEYRIGWINQNSKYHRFFGFTYPNIDNAKRAYSQGIIGDYTFKAIMRAGLYAGVPPQNTPLGGQIGIHGLGSANPAVHESFDWTHGCIAMTNQQVDRLSQWVRKGMLVVIR